MFSKKYTLTSLVARALVNDFSPGVLFRIGSCSRQSLGLAPCRLSCALRCEKRYGYCHFYFARVTTTAVSLSRPPGTTTQKFTPLSKTGYATGALGGSRRRTSKHLRYTPQIFFSHGPHVVSAADDPDKRSRSGRLGLRGPAPKPLR
jgi:hypothetical protein